MDVLEYLAQPGLEDIWIFLDIKVRDNPSFSYNIHIKQTIARQPSNNSPANRQGALQHPLHQTMALANRPRNLGRAFRATIHKTPTTVSHHAGVFRSELRAAIPTYPERWIQHQPKGADGSVRTGVPGGSTGRETTSLPVDGERGEYDELESTEEGGWGGNG